MHVFFSFFHVWLHGVIDIWQGNSNKLSLNIATILIHESSNFSCMLNCHHTSPGPNPSCKDKANSQGTPNVFKLSLLVDLWFFKKNSFFSRVNFIPIYMTLRRPELLVFSVWFNKENKLLCQEFYWLNPNKILFFFPLKVFHLNELSTICI